MTQAARRSRSRTGGRGEECNGEGRALFSCLRRKGMCCLSKGRGGKVHRLLGDRTLIYSMLSWNEGQAGEENCARVAQEPELATREVIWWFARRQQPC